MSNLKQRLKSYKFWLSLGSAIFLILKVIGQNFGFSVDENIFNEIFTAICSLLVLLGIIAPPSNSKKASGDSNVTSSESGTNGSGEEVNMEEENRVESSDKQLSEIDTKFKLNLLKNNLIFVKSILDGCNSNCDMSEEIDEIIDEVFSISEEEKTQKCQDLIENRVQNGNLNEKFENLNENDVANFDDEKSAFRECDSEVKADCEAAEDEKIEQPKQENFCKFEFEDENNCNFNETKIATEFETKSEFEIKNEFENTENTAVESIESEALDKSAATESKVSTESEVETVETVESKSSTETTLSKCLSVESTPSDSLSAESTPSDSLSNKNTLSDSLSVESTPSDLVEPENEKRPVVRRGAMAKALHLYLKK